MPRKLESTDDVPTYVMNESFWLILTKWSIVHGLHIHIYFLYTHTVFPCGWFNHISLKLSSYLYIKLIIKISSSLSNLIFTKYKYTFIYLNLQTCTIKLPLMSSKFLQNQQFFMKIC